MSARERQPPFPLIGLALHHRGQRLRHQLINLPDVGSAPVSWWSRITARTAR
jgi:hypothetical protein